MKHFSFNKTNLSIALALFAMTFFTNCEKDEQDGLNDQTIIEQGNGVIIINEGSFQNENSSLSYIDKINDKIHNDLFYKVNERLLGDVFQSMEIINEKAYLVINNSGVIEVVEPETVEHVATIEGFTSPRHILPVDDETAYVSDLFAGKIWIVNLIDHSVESEIYFPGGWSESMLKLSGRIFVSAPDANKVYIIDPTSHTITDSLAVLPHPGTMTVDKYGMLWVLSEGTWEGKTGGLTAIDPGTLEITTELPFPDGSGLYSKLTVNKAGDMLYFIGNDVWKYNINDTVLPSEPLIKNKGEFFYGLGVSPSTGNIYVSDAVDFNQKVKLLQFTPSGDKINSFDAGIVPAGFVFY